MSKCVAVPAAIIAAFIAVVTLAPFAGAPAWADSNEDEARQALEHGDIRPLDEVLAVAKQRLPGDVVKVKLEHDDGRWKYEIKILTDKGERREVEIDATSLRILEVE